MHKGPQFLFHFKNKKNENDELPAKIGYFKLKRQSVVLDSEEEDYSTDNDSLEFENWVVSDFIKDYGATNNNDG